MNTTNIKYRFTTSWHQKKFTIVGVLLCVLVSIVLFYNSSQRYQILSKVTHDLINRFCFPHLLFSTLSIVAVFFVGFIWVTKNYSFEYPFTKNSVELNPKNENCTNELLTTFEGILWEYDTKRSKMRFYSEKIESILGYTLNESKQRTDFWKEVIHHNDLELVLKNLRQNVKHVPQTNLEFRMIAKNGNIVWMKNIFIYQKEKESCLKGVIFNITKAKEMEKELKKAITIVKDKNIRLVNFSYIVSHNIRSHTSNIQSISNFMEVTKSATEQKQMIELLQSASNSLNQTVTDLNDVVNVQTKLNFVSKSLNLKQNITDIENMLAEQIQTSRATIINSIPDNLIINYNPAYLESILYNLISNALRFKHPDRDPVITIKWINEKDKNILEISDNGIGIDLTKNADKLFGMYHTFHKNMKSKGMGLFSTKNQIEAMGEKIWVESTVNIGTTFKLTFS